MPKKKKGIPVFEVDNVKIKQIQNSFLKPPNESHTLQSQLKRYTFVIIWHLVVKIPIMELLTDPHSNLSINQLLVKNISKHP